jgi:hypothetical protein
VLTLRVARLGRQDKTVYGFMESRVESSGFRA